MRRVSVILSIVLAVGLSAAGPALAQSKEPVKIGLSAAVSGGSAASGEAIKRGLQIAIDEINAKGGVLGGRKLELVIRDDEGNPQKGVTIARELVEREKVAAVFGGLHTTVALAQVPPTADPQQRLPNLLGAAHVHLMLGNRDQAVELMDTFFPILRAMSSRAPSPGGDIATMYVRTGHAEDWLDLCRTRFAETGRVWAAKLICEGHTVDGAELLQQLIAVGYGTRTRRFRERKRSDIAQIERRHAQYHTGKRRTQNFRLGVSRTRVEIRGIVETHAYSGGDAAAAAATSAARLNQFTAFCRMRSVSVSPRRCAVVINAASR